MSEDVPVMKLKLKNPSFSTTTTRNNIVSKIEVDTQTRQVQNIFRLKDLATLCLVVSHPLQDGETTYYLQDKRDIETVLQYANQNNIIVKEYV